MAVELDEPLLDVESDELPELELPELAPELEFGLVPPELEPEELPDPLLPEPDDDPESLDESELPESLELTFPSTSATWSVNCVPFSVEVPLAPVPEVRFSFESELRPRYDGLLGTRTFR